MKELVLALITGLVVGAVFKLLKLPLPAPPVLPGILGIVGIYLGGIIVQRLIDWFK
ncbi:XapX domain-containing protein [Aneurinibacillus uraniidurans]|uniref:XapX domain-containing protein n=1 Tax=Aneurinibacillus uraniidurans TaxID=2966586 RepID=UPI002349383D|nr:XapX domain-containing protein [Aneurinibacillus sp. B1]WCN38440.1 XapX domain-containing protein [Aneurinibacillus sp. B1]